MGAMSFLLSADMPLSDVNSRSIVFEAKNRIPAWWLPCFRTSDLCAVDVELEDDEGMSTREQYPMLAVAKELALERARRFAASISEDDGVRATTGIFTEMFLERLATSLGAIVQLYDLEIQLMVGPHEHSSWLHAVLKFVDDVAAKRCVGSALQTSDGAVQLFDQAGIELPAWTTSDWKYALLGYAPA
jgi:hypothetical protein